MAISVAQPSPRCPFRGPHSPLFTTPGVQPGFTPFHDATPITCTYNCTVYDCLLGLAKALHYNFFNFDTFDVEEYEHFEQVTSFHMQSEMADLCALFYATRPFRSKTAI